MLARKIHGEGASGGWQWFRGRVRRIGRSFRRQAAIGDKGLIALLPFEAKATLPCRMRHAANYAACTVCSAKPSEAESSSPAAPSRNGGLFAKLSACFDARVLSVAHEHIDRVFACACAQDRTAEHLRASVDDERVMAAWQSPGADVAKSRCGCGRVPGADVAESPVGAPPPVQLGRPERAAVATGNTAQEMRIAARRTRAAAARAAASTPAVRRCTAGAPPSGLRA